MKHIIHIIIPTLFLTFIYGCEENPDIAESKAVIEGYFPSGGYPYVIFSSSIVPGKGGNISDAVINWGKVTVSDGDTTVILSGRVDHSVTPPFLYYSFDIAGEPGKTYSVTADFKNLHAHASVRMLPPTDIDSITITPAGTDTLRAATVHFTSPSDIPAFFYLSMRKNERNAARLPCMMGTIRTDIPGAHYSLPLLRPRQRIDSVKYMPQFVIGEEWTVNLNRVDKSVYDFWKAFDDMIMFSASPFITTSESLPTNVAGGFGIWSVEGTSQAFLKIE